MMQNSELPFSIVEQHLTLDQAGAVQAALIRGVGTALKLVVEKLSEEYIREENPPLNWMKDALERAIPPALAAVILRCIDAYPARLEPTHPDFGFAMNFVVGAIKDSYGQACNNTKARA